jgi:cytochrome c peroxidase
MRRITIAVLMLAVSLTLTAQQQVSEKDKTLANQVYQAQMSGNDSAFYLAEEVLMNYQKKQEKLGKILFCMA